MIKYIELTCFRQHESLKIDFASGLNVLRGANESGKTTITEGILYALFGATALIDALPLVVTWGRKESELKVRLFIVIGTIEYMFLRSKGGATCTYELPGQSVVVTGQKEVTSFAAELLGGDAKVASMLMLSSQAGLRGALDEGPAAVGALMSKLADADTIDRLLKVADETLSLGSATQLEQRLVQAEDEVVEAKEATVNPAVLVALDQQIIAKKNAHINEDLKSQVLSTAAQKAQDATNAAMQNNDSVFAGTKRVKEAMDVLEAERSRLAVAEKQAADRPDAMKVAKTRDALNAAKNHSVILKAYATFQSLPGVPEQTWDKDHESFSVFYTECTDALAAAARCVIESDAVVNELRKSIMKEDSKCPTCGHVADNHAHVLEHNKKVAEGLAALAPKRTELSTKVVECNTTIEVLKKIDAAAVWRRKHVEGISGYVEFDTATYPPKITWKGDPPSPLPTSIRQLEEAIASFESQEHKAVQAQGAANAHKAAIVEAEKVVKTAQDVRLLMEMIDVAPLQAAYDTAFRAYIECRQNVGVLANELADLKDEYTRLKTLAEGAKAREEAAARRVVELKADIVTLAFNNELVKKLKSMKPLITDHLWNSVLGAVSNFFTMLRGEQSIVTKDGTGFKVNGKGGSLSGSTLDMLALSIRVALSKTFVPHASFMVLDEPGHGCDTDRTGNMLGFLAGAGFNQTILASHDEMSESIADNVILLGA